MTHRPRKRFGQHFLRDAAVLERLTAAIDPRPDDAMVEIGPGRGALTRKLLARCDHLHVVELDRDLAGELEARLAPGRSGRAGLEVHQADALGLDFCALAAAGRRLRIVGNLPYNISTPLLFHLLDGIECIRDMHFMLQWEVVERMAAGPGGGRAYGRLSLMVQADCTVEPLFRVPAQAFRPPPKVESAVVRLIPRERSPVAAHLRGRFDTLVRLAFGQRRKTLRNSLRPLLDASAIRRAGIDPAARPEALSLNDFARLAEE